MIFYNIGINIPNFLCWIPNMKSVFWGQKNPKLDPKFSHDIYQHWDEHSQCMTSISQHPLWNCISQWNPKKLPSIPQHWETNSHDWVMNLGILKEFSIRELVIFSCVLGEVIGLSAERGDFLAIDVSVEPFWAKWGCLFMTAYKKTRSIHCTLGSFSIDGSETPF